MLASSAVDREGLKENKRVRGWQTPSSSTLYATNPAVTGLFKSFKL
jgi:hypothetical protein